MPTNQKILQSFRNYTPIILQLVGVFIILANLWLFSKLAPIQQNLAVMAADIDNLHKGVDIISNQHNNLVTKEEFQLLIDRIDRISSRVDSIYTIITR